MPQTFTRDRITWLAYWMLSFYSFYINIFGPITPYLKSDLNLSYTVSSLHTSAFAAGILAVGFGGHLIIRRTGRMRALWIGAAGLSLSALMLAVGQNPIVTISASFLMGCLGSLILAVIPSTLSERHGEQRAVAISEANTIASAFAAAAPLIVGWLAVSPLGWRSSLAVLVFLPVLLYAANAHNQAPSASIQPVQTAKKTKSLPRRYWFSWTAIVLVVSVEFCMIYWSADYLEINFGIARSLASQAVSLFLIAMILGRLAASQLVQRFPARSLVAFSILLALAGFCAYWLAGAVWLSLAGLFVCGLGVAGLYPLTLSLAIAAGGAQADLAGARATLASGTAILTLPLVLGRLADAAGIHTAYILVAILLVTALALVQLSAKLFPETRPAALQSDLELHRSTGE